MKSVCSVGNDGIYFPRLLLILNVNCNSQTLTNFENKKNKFEFTLIEVVSGLCLTLPFGSSICFIHLHTTTERGRSRDRSVVKARQSISSLLCSFPGSNVHIVSNNQLPKVVLWPQHISCVHTRLHTEIVYTHINKKE